LVALLLCLKLYFEIKTRQDAEERVRSQEIKAQKNASLATLGEISTLVSHEINQPLAAIEVYASTCSHKLMKRGFEAEQKEERHSLLQAQNNIKKEVARIKKIIDSIRGLAKRKSSEMRRLSIAETIEAIRPLIAIQAKSIGSVIEVSVDKKADVVFDPSALEQVLLNVIRNGLESMIKTDGAKVLRIQADALDAKLVRLQVIDRGTGIPPAFQDKVFSPFFSTKESGTGLGLNYCYSLLEKFGGRIWFEASPTGGTVFNIDLPRAQDS
jgi:two-component system sensor histidine kinase DctS